MSKSEQLAALRERIEELPAEAEAEVVSLQQSIARLEEEIQQDVSAWDRVQLSRHESRPYTLDYIERIFDSFRPLHGDRRYADDPAIVGGTALLEGRPVLVLGHQKGRNTRERLHRNYGMPRPEGYRKALRLMQLAEKFNRPVLSFVDTPGAYPGLGAEERGQAQAIAHNLRSMACLKTPVVVTILGEGGSGGALAIALGDRVMMLENSIYSVISPESCSAILWKDQDHVREAAESLKLTSNDLMRLGIIDEILPEPRPGAHADWDQMASDLKSALLRHLDDLEGLGSEDLLTKRYEKFRHMGQFIEETNPT